MQAMLTRKLHVKGNMSVMMRNVPSVLDFVRCAKENTDEFVLIFVRDVGKWVISERHQLRHSNS
jgi:hypothetical protein